MWGSLSRTWSRRGQQPLVKTTGIRKGLKVYGVIENVLKPLKQQVYKTLEAFIHVAMIRKSLMFLQRGYSGSSG
uniref:Uncharacterized protein n=1 Tax=uncultured Thiotrichaceae bacterium TaxID=298394 RepID=A0A6S6SCV1_9GAMM|nr:MAG: Unknown protein [uncultured Thiotrichaceae bacterium]